MKQTVRLNENEFKNLIRGIISEMTDATQGMPSDVNADTTNLEEDVEEGFIDNMKSAVGGFTGKGGFGKNAAPMNNSGLNLKQRWDSAKANYKARDTYDTKDSLYNWLKNFDSNMTVGDLMKQLWNEKMKAARMGASAKRNIGKE